MVLGYINSKKKKIKRKNQGISSQNDGQIEVAWG